MGNEQDLSKWLENWDKAQKTAKFNTAPVKKDAKILSEGVNKPKQVVPNLKNVDNKYWDQIYRASKGERVIKEDADEPVNSKPVGKQRQVPDKDALSVKGAELNNTGNPVYPSTRGDDTRNHTTPEFSDGKKLRDIANMKYSLYNLQAKLNSSPKFGAYGKEAPEVKKIQGQIDDLNKKIDELSNSLSPDFVEDENS